MQELTLQIKAFLRPISSLSQQEQELFAAAINVRKNAQAPYSNFHVGAAVLDTHGKIHTGCNVERCSWSQTTHAEQNAIDSMISASGPTKISIVAVAAAPKQIELSLQSNSTAVQSTFADAKIACGHCLQIIWENCLNDPSVLFLSITEHGYIFQATIGDMLPFRFGPEALGIDYGK